VLCKHLIDQRHGGKSLASARDLVLEYWQPLFPASFDVVSLLPPADEDLDEAAAFERCRGAATDLIFPGYSAAGSDGDLRHLVLESIEREGITRDSDPPLADYAIDCI